MRQICIISVSLMTKRVKISHAERRKAQEYYDPTMVVVLLLVVIDYYFVMKQEVESSNINSFPLLIS